MTKDKLIKARDHFENLLLQYVSMAQYHLSNDDKISHNECLEDKTYYELVISLIDAQIKACDDRAEPVNRQMLDALKECREFLMCKDCPFQPSLLHKVCQAITAAEQQLEMENG